MFRKFFESIISESNDERLHSAATNLRNQIEAHAILAGNYTQYENTVGNSDQRQRLRSTPSREDESDASQQTNFLKCLDCGHIVQVDAAQSRTNSNACGFCSQLSLQPIISNMTVNNKHLELPIAETHFSGCKEVRQRRHVRSASSGGEPKALVVLAQKTNKEELAETIVREQSTSTADRLAVPVINVMINVNTDNHQHTIVSKSVSIDDDNTQVVNLQVHIQRTRNSTDEQVEPNPKQMHNQIECYQSANTAEQADETSQQTWMNVIENRRSYTDTRQEYIDSIVKMFEMARDEKIRFRATVFTNPDDSRSIAKRTNSSNDNLISDSGIISKVHVLLETNPSQGESIRFSVPLHILDEVLDRWPFVCTLFDVFIDKACANRDTAIANWIHQWLETIVMKIPSESKAVLRNVKI